MHYLSKELSVFLAEHFARRKIKVDVRSLRSEMDICETLDIDALDIDVLIEALHKVYPFDYSNIDLVNFFGTGLSLVDNNIEFFRRIFGNKKWIPPPKKEWRKFTFGMLDHAIHTGKLE